MTIGQQIACVRREIRMRKVVYPGLVRRSKMTQGDAIFELVAMEAVLATLLRIEQSEPLSLLP
jgi:hypothetical protein